MSSDSLRRLGERLRAAGLAPRALAAWAGTDRLDLLGRRVAALRTAEPAPAAAALALFVAGAELSIDAARLPCDELDEAGLVERSGDRLRARVAVLPLGRALLVCDRADAPVEHALVCWPDGSSYHLAGAVPPPRRARWLDLGCGSAFAALARPEAAEQLAGLDLNPRAVGYARLGFALSGIDRAEILAGDIAAARGSAELVTCNAPILDTPHAAIWRRADAAFFTRLADVIPARLAPGGLAIVHATRAALPSDLPGERVFVSYAPDRDFGVLWWRPDAPERELVKHRTLTVERPHLDHQDCIEIEPLR